MAKLTLQHIKGSTYYVPSPTNVGVFADGKNAICIDSGNDKEAGRQLLRLIENQGWKLQVIINTHSNADHIGGNAYLQEKTGCDIAATRMEAAFINDPVLEPSFLYGGFPFTGLKNKFLMAKPSSVTTIISSEGQILDTGLQAFSLPGHFFDMIGVMTQDNVFFIADTLFPANIIHKYHLFFLWDIRAHLASLERLKNTEAELYVPSHGEPLRRIDALIETNQGKIIEIIDRIQSICQDPATSEEVLQQICALYEIELNANQYVLVSSTIRSFLSYLYEEGGLECIFGDGKMTWKSK